MNKPVVWTIAGSDPSGSAGVQVDLKTLHQLGVHGCSIITAMTAQNVHELKAIEYPTPDHVQLQLAMLSNDLPAQVIKLGLLGTREINEKIIHFLRSYSGKIVLDPVMISTFEQSLHTQGLTNYLLQLKQFFPYVDLLTPNLLEAEKILSQPLQSYKDIEAGAQAILNLGVKSVLIKGGHFTNDEFSQDYWTNGIDSFWLSHPRSSIKRYRGTGCVLASAIAAALAQDYSMQDAVVIGKMYINNSLRCAQVLNTELALIEQNAWPTAEVDLPFVTDQPLYHSPLVFPTCGNKLLGIYPIVDNTSWFEKLLPLGINTIQLRIKKNENISEEIQRAVMLANQYHARLFINDYWELAIQHGAYGVHLGQEDLKQADINRIHQAGLRLGISTHNYREVARAHSLKPSYIACGPIFATTSKQMPHTPQGIPRLKYWRELLNYPLVAIGGINHARLPEVLTTKVDGIAMISAIIAAKDHGQEIKSLFDSLTK